VAHSLGDQVDTNFTRGAPYKIWEGKQRPKFSAIFNNFRLWSQISQEWTDISKIRKVLDQPHFIPYWAKKIGKLWSTNNKVIDAHVDPPKWTFLEDYISATRGHWPLIFLHALDTGQGLPVYTINRVGGPLKNFKGQHLKLGLKFYICASITLG